MNATTKRPTRKASGTTFTKNPDTGCWEAEGICVNPTYTGNMCSKIHNYVIVVNGKQWTRKSFQEALESAVEFKNRTKEPIHA